MALLGKGVFVSGLFATALLVVIALLPDLRDRQAWRFYEPSLLMALP